MDFVNILLFCLMSCVLGAVLMLLIQYYAFVRYLNVPEQSEEQKLYNEKYFLPDVSLLIFPLLYNVKILLFFIFVV